MISGGGTGIGRACAHAFAGRGDRVLILGRSAETLAEAARTGGAGGIHPLVVDLTDPAAPALVVDRALDLFGRVDVLVNNAATTSFAAMGELTRAATVAQIETNLLAPILLTQQALGALENTRGTVVNISSAGSLGLRSMPTNSVYAATKAGLDMLTRTWAVELAPRGVRVIGLAPGLVDTGVGVRGGMTQASYEQFLSEMAPRIPSGRVAAPAEIAWWVLRLTETGAEYANGVVVAVDGALSVT